MAALVSRSGSSGRPNRMTLLERSRLGYEDESPPGLLLACEPLPLGKGLDVAAVLVLEC